MRYYMAMKLNLWSKVEALTPQPQPIGGCGHSVGFMLVYETVEALHRDWPGAPYKTIEEITDEGR